MVNTIIEHSPSRRLQLSIVAPIESKLPPLKNEYNPKINSFFTLYHGNRRTLYITVYIDGKRWNSNENSLPAQKSATFSSSTNKCASSVSFRCNNFANQLKLSRTFPVKLTFCQRRSEEMNVP